MFEPLPEIIRLAGEQQKLTLVQLASKSGVSRRTIADLERGDTNVTLAVLTKLARAFQLEELRIGNVRLRWAPPGLDILLEAQHAIAMARQVIRTADFAEAELAKAAKRLEQVVAQLVPSIDADGVHAYIERLGSERTEKPAAIPHAAAVATPIPPSARPNTLTKTGTKRGRRNPRVERRAGFPTQLRQRRLLLTPPHPSMFKRARAARGHAPQTERVAAALESLAAARPYAVAAVPGTMWPSGCCRSSITMRWNRELVSRPLIAVQRNLGSLMKLSMEVEISPHFSRAQAIDRQRVIEAPGPPASRRLMRGRLARASVRSRVPPPALAARRSGVVG